MDDSTTKRDLSQVACSTRIKFTNVFFQEMTRANLVYEQSRYGIGEKRDSQRKSDRNQRIIFSLEMFFFSPSSINESFSRNPYEIRSSIFGARVEKRCDKQIQDLRSRKFVFAVPFFHFSISFPSYILSSRTRKFKNVCVFNNQMLSLSWTNRINQVHVLRGKMISIRPIDKVLFNFSTHDRFIRDSKVRSMRKTRNSVGSKLRCCTYLKFFVRKDYRLGVEYISRDGRSSTGWMINHCERCEIFVKATKRGMQIEWCVALRRSGKSTRCTDLEKCDTRCSRNSSEAGPKSYNAPLDSSLVSRLPLHFYEYPDISNHFSYYPYLLLPSPYFHNA